ncbi:MAG: hypothetical protein DCC49_10650 [Acidobacteria bacterium]|nr:MAG: hypothetical protein DCC49_10650 [Acidobacteriota bacterium]
MVWLTVCLDAFLVVYIRELLIAKANGDGDAMIFLVPMTAWAAIVTVSGTLLAIMAARGAAAANVTGVIFAVVGSGPVLLLTFPSTLGYPALLVYFFVLAGSVAATVAVFTVAQKPS